MTTITLDVNGNSQAVTVEPRWSLAEVLRGPLGLVGTHVGCEHGVCGACTVLVDDQPVRSCLVLAVQVEGARIETVESLAAGGELSELQQAFRRHHGLQCGFCTPGFLMLAASLLRRADPPSEEELVDVLASNLCRCTGYQGILDAVRSVVTTR